MVVPSRGFKKKSKVKLGPQPPVKASRISSNMANTTTLASSTRTANPSLTTLLPIVRSPNRAKASESTSGTATKDKKLSRSTNEKSSTSANSTDDKLLFEVDQPIQNRYKVYERLGKGAYGIVWEAEDVQTGTKVALKKIFDAFRNDTDAQRTYREIIFLREFGKHPNIIRLLNAHKATNNLDIYLVFPLLDYDLHKMIKEKSTLKDNTIRLIFYQILKAVKYMHSAQVIHRDLKPANILLDKNNHVKVADFGLARSLTDLNDISMEKGDHLMTEYVATRWYRPPEILLSCRKYSKGVDIWGLGCILGEMLLRKAVFPGNTTIEQVQIIMGVIAKPTQEEIQDLCGSQSNVSIIQNALNERKDTLYELFSRNACELDSIDLMEKLLVFHPSKRVKVEDALKHHFLAKYRKESEEITLTHSVSPPLNDNIQLPLNDYRSVIYDLLQLRRSRPPTNVNLREVRASKSVVNTAIINTNPPPEEKPRSILTLPKKIRPAAVGRRQTNAQALNTKNDTMEARSNHNNVLKKTRSSIVFNSTKNQASSQEKIQYSDHQYNHSTSKPMEFGDTEYSPKLSQRHSSFHNTSEDRIEIGTEPMQQYGHLMKMEPITEIDMEVSDYEHEFPKENPTLHFQRYGKRQDTACPEVSYDFQVQTNEVAGDHVHESMFDAYGDELSLKKFEQTLCMNDTLPAVVVTRSEESVPQRKEKSQQALRNSYPKHVEDHIVRPSNYANKSKEKIDKIKDLAMSKNSRDEIPPDWYFQGIGKGRKLDHNQRQNFNTQQKQIPHHQPAKPSRSTIFHCPEENRPRIQHSSYFPDAHTTGQNLRRNGLGLPKQNQQQVPTFHPNNEVKQRRGIYDSYTQTHGTISASDLCELKSFSLFNRK